MAQNLAIVNGKPIPKTRVDALAQQMARAGRPVTPEQQNQLKDEVIAREIFMQEATKRGLDATDDFKNQIELARQTILIRELFADFQKKNPVSDAEVKAEYDKFAAANGGKEYRARHILVEKEDEAKAIIAQLKKGAQVRRHRQEIVQGPGLRRQWRRSRLGQRRQLRARVLCRHGQARQGPDDRRAREDPVRLPHHPRRRRARSPAAPVRRGQAADCPADCSSRSWPSTRKNCAARPRSNRRLHASRDNAASAAFFLGRGFPDRSVGWRSSIPRSLVTSIRAGLQCSGSGLAGFPTEGRVSACLRKPMICSSPSLLVLMSIILRVDGLLRKK